MPGSEVMKTESENEPWLSIGEACRVLGVSEATLRQWTDGGKIQVFITPGGHRRYDRQKIQEFMLSHQKTLGIQDLVAKIEGTAEPHREIGAAFTSQPDSLASFDADRKQHLAHLGRRILDLIASYVSSREKRGESIQQARAVGQEFGSTLAAAGLTLTDSIQSFTSHRRPIVEGVMAMMKQREIIAEDILKALPLIDEIMDQTLLSLVEAHQREQRPPVC
jgi:excisionase family DNA binding protein